MGHGNRTTLGWRCHTRAQPECDMFNLGSSYFHVPLTTVRHLLNVTLTTVHNLYNAVWCSCVVVRLVFGRRLAVVGQRIAAWFFRLNDNSELSGNLEHFASLVVEHKKTKSLYIHCVCLTSKNVTELCCYCTASQRGSSTFSAVTWAIGLLE